MTPGEGYAEREGLQQGRPRVWGWGDGGWARCGASCPLHSCSAGTAARGLSVGRGCTRPGSSVELRTREC